MTNYIGYFSDNDCNQYTVEIIRDATNTARTEILMAGSQPFVVNYDESATPFDPVRSSTASIGIVSEDYLGELITGYVHGTKVLLKKGSEIMWHGYLNSNTLNQSFDNCLESITLEASDGVALLQYIDYEPLNGQYKDVVSVKSLLDKICNRCGLDRYYVGIDKKVDGEDFWLGSAKISEQNFFSSDSDDPWKMSEVAEEICKYFGWTLLQWKNALYFIDYKDYSNHATLKVQQYDRTSAGFAGITTYLNSQLDIVDNEPFMGSNNSVTYESIINKATVKDSFYEPKPFVPELFNEDDMTNRYGEPYKYENLINIFDAPTYLNSKGKIVKDATEEGHDYWRRIWDNKWYDSHYYNDSFVEQTLTPAQKKAYNITTAYIGGTLESIAETDAKKIDNDASFDDVLVISTKNYDYSQLHPRQDVKMFDLKEVYHHPIVINPETAYIMLDCSAYWARYQGRQWMNSDWSNEYSKKNGLYQEDVANREPALYFQLQVDGLWWTGNAWSTDESTFKVLMEDRRTSKQEEANQPGDNWASDLNIANTMSWQRFSGGKGYTIPLADTFDGYVHEVYFAICCPENIQKIISTRHIDGTGTYYCFVKNLKLELVNDYREYAIKDVTYENIIDDYSCREMSEINLKLTTCPEKERLSYSNVGYGGGYLKKIAEGGININLPQMPEENILQKYVDQYSTPTATMNLTLNLDFLPFSRIYNSWTNSHCVILSQQIDFAAGSQSVKITEIK